MILITAFKPFGFIRGTLMGKNASLEVLDKLRAAGTANADFLVLDVSDGGILRLRKHLHEQSPSAVLCMGELATLPGAKVKLEPFAVNSRPSVLPDFLAPKAPLQPSPFALEQKADQVRSTIGRYYCNAAYLAALQWAQASRNQPVAFVHVPVLGERAEHVKQVQDILWQMQSR